MKEPNGVQDARHVHSVQIPANQANQANSVRCPYNSKGQKRGAIAVLYIPTAKPCPENKGSGQVSSLLIPPSRARCSATRSCGHGSAKRASPQPILAVPILLSAHTQPTTTPEQLRHTNTLILQPCLQDKGVRCPNCLNPQSRQPR